MFGANAASYTEAGYLFGRTYYENLGVLQRQQPLGGIS